MSNEQPESKPPSTKINKSDIQSSQELLSQLQIFLKTQSIRVVRGAINLLEGVLVKLEKASPAEPTGKTLNNLAHIQAWWKAVLGKIRPLLTENLSSKLSDTALTGIIAGAAISIIWVISTLLPGKTPEVASINPTEPIPPAPTIVSPPELTAPAPPVPVEIDSPPPEPIPAPTVELTPEQNLITSIEKQVAEITDQYADGLIKSIQANQGSRVTIKVGEDWYNLPTESQDKLAARMLKRSQELEFSNLEIADLQGKLLARSPVVGTEMVILRRQVVSPQQQARE